MSAVLFVSNGHGESAIAERIAAEVASLSPQTRRDHLALVGDMPSESLHDVGPRGAMPSGGLIAMGNVRNIARDVRAGLLGLTLSQRAFLRSVRGSYDATVAVGDVFSLVMALQARAPAIFVGTAKSVNVAPYGPFETRMLRRAAACFVRDAPTAERLRARGVRAETANVIADLAVSDDDPRAERAAGDFAPAVALFPGSRTSAYEQAAFLLDVTAGLIEARAGLGAILSVSRNLEIERFAAVARRGGWEVALSGDDATPFTLAIGGRIGVRAWRGALAPLFPRVTLVLGQAGTANEAAAAAGVPIVAFQNREEPGPSWYRQRQSALLGEAMTILPADLVNAPTAILALLDDAPRRARMSAAGRERLGEPGAAQRIARRIAGTLGA